MCTSENVGLCTVSDSRVLISGQGGEGGEFLTNATNSKLQTAAHTVRSYHAASEIGWLHVAEQLESSNTSKESQMPAFKRMIVYRKTIGLQSHHTCYGDQCFKFGP